MANVIGPGATEDVIVERGSLLDNASDYEYVTLLNPLTEDFAISVAQDVPVDLPFKIKDQTAMIQGEGDVIRNYGIPLKNRDHPAKKHIINKAVIPAGGTINLPGNEAQVALRQLVNEVLQREGKRLLISDPTLRRQVEERIIQNRGSVQDLMDTQLKTPRTQIQEAINNSNEVHDETAFPGLKQADSSPEATVTDTPNPDVSSPKKLGRPKKTDS